MDHERLNTWHKTRREVQEDYEGADTCHVTKVLTSYGEPNVRHVDESSNRSRMIEYWVWDENSKKVKEDRIFNIGEAPTS